MADEFLACSVENCNRSARERGGGVTIKLCRKHYKRWWRHGDPTAGSTGMNARPDWIEANKGHQGDECLRWPFSLGPHGYGQFKIGGRSTLASHAMCIAAHGPKPDGDYQAAHSCGNGHMACVNPRHLRWATRIENSADARAHGTIARGTRQGSAKLTESEVVEIRRLAGSMTENNLSERFGVNRATIGKVIRRERWAWLE